MTQRLRSTLVLLELDTGGVSGVSVPWREVEDARFERRGCVCRRNWSTGRPSPLGARMPPVIER